jgi:hypothetical protein
MGFYMETFEASVQSGELPVNYSDHAAIYSILRYSMLYIKTTRNISM